MLHLNRNPNCYGCFAARCPFYLAPPRVTSCGGFLLLAVLLSLSPLFAVVLGDSIWRFWPTEAFVAVETRDLLRRRVDFVVLHPVTGASLLRYHDPTMPWWLTLASADATTLYLAEPDPTHLGQIRAYRALDPVTGRVRWRRPLAEGTAAPAPLSAGTAVPTVYAPASPHFAALAAFVAARTGQHPVTRLEYLETPALLALAYELPGTEPPENEFLVCAATDGRLLLRHPLGQAAAGPEAGLFCIFGPTLYALSAGGTVLAWAVDCSN